MRKWLIKRALSILSKYDKKNIYVRVDKLTIKQEEIVLKSLTSKLTNTPIHERVFKHLKEKENL